MSFYEPINFRVRRGTQAALRQVAKRDDVTVSQFVRDLLDEAFRVRGVSPDEATPDIPRHIRNPHGINTSA